MRIEASFGHEVGGVRTISRCIRFGHVSDGTRFIRFGCLSSNGLKLRRRRQALWGQAELGGFAALVLRTDGPFAAKPFAGIHRARTIADFCFVSFFTLF